MELRDARKRGGPNAMTGSPAYQHLSSEALEEHRQVHFYVDQLLRTLADLEGPDQDEGMRRLAAELGSLIDRLTEHFEVEEHGGLFHGVLDLLPHLGNEVGGLSAQHTHLLETLEVARIHAQRAGAAGAPGLRADLEAFVAELRLHEQAEEQILAQALELEGRM
jgi:hypothetical protein